MSKNPGPKRGQENKYFMEVVFSQKVNTIRQWRMVVVFFESELNSACGVLPGSIYSAQNVPIHKEVWGRAPVHFTCHWKFWRKTRFKSYFSHSPVYFWFLRTLWSLRTSRQSLLVVFAVSYSNWLVVFLKTQYKVAFVNKLLDTDCRLTPTQGLILTSRSKHLQVTAVTL